MTLPDLLRPKHSIAGRLTLRVTGTILAVFAVITIVLVFLGMWFGVIAGSIQYIGSQRTTNEKINNILTSVEVAVTNTIPEIEESLDNPKSMYLIVERLLMLNPNIVGSAIAFEPNYYPQEGVYFAPYALRKDAATIELKQLGNVDYEYHYMDWYQIPKLLEKPYWSEPYYDEGGGNQTMTTYSQPLFNTRGEMYAVITADISLDWLTDFTREIDSINYQNYLFDDSTPSHTFIIGRSGTYIVHPDKKRILSESIFSDCMETETEEDDSIARKMIAGHEAWESVTINDQRQMLFYSPIKHIGWSMGTFVPWSSVSLMGSILGGIFLIIMAIGLFIVFLVCHLTIRRVTKPLKQFAASADEIARGNIETTLPAIKTQDEMRRLYDSFHTMQTSLLQQIEETKEVNEQKGRIESELLIARNIQMSMLPKTFPAFPERDDVDLYAQLTPAKEVGGDLYDFFIRDEKLYFCVGDVSGKGVPASLLMAVTRSLFRSISSHNSSPAFIVSHINDAMAETNDNMMFVTLFVGILDLPTGRLRYCNAGHCAPVLVGAGMGLLPIVPNIPLGVMTGYKYEMQEAIIYPGTIIFLYTDGLTEAENASKELFEETRMLRVCQDIYANIQQVTPNSFITQMTETVRDFVQEAEASDDLTMMAIRYTRQQEEATLRRNLVLPNDIDTIPQLNEFLDGVCEESGLDMSTTMSLNLAVEEAVVNVMNYAYPPGVKGDVHIEAVANNRRLKIVISDSGKQFDPTAKSEVDTTLSVEERPIGGLGIHLVRQIMDSVNYEYVEGRNVLTLRKLLPDRDQETI